MKRISKWYQGLKLNMKFTIVIVLLAWLPIVFLGVILFSSMRNDLLKEKSSSMVYELQEDYAQFLKNVDSINMSTQFFVSDQKLIEFLESVKKQEPMETEQLRTFYHENIASLERLVNNNPYLYQIRVYAPSDTMQEMMPILYRQDRMQRLDWGKGAPKTLEGWHFNYTDQLFDSFVMDQGRKIMSYVTGMESYGIGEIGILEVAMRMETMFPKLYAAEQDNWGCFLDQDGNAYLGSMDSEELRRLLERILAEAEKAAAKAGPQQTQTPAEAKKAGNQTALSEAGNQVYQIELDGKQFVVGYLPVKELSGTWIRVNDLSEGMEVVRKQQNAYLVVMLVAMLLLAAVVDQVVKGVLKHFYSILFSIRQVQKGDLDVVIEISGSDEMAELGEQINKMLERIRQLMDDNLKRGLLAKNAEIKALQNQINAHFIYNVLESIKMMAEIDEEYEISDAVTKLGRLLRYNLRWTSGNVTVREELDYIRNYLALINLRFDYEIYLSENLPDVILDQEIPKMSLQPIVENAIYHGIEQMAEDTNIYIKGVIGEDSCTIEITDAGVGMSEEQLLQVRRKIAGEVEIDAAGGHGIGLKNVQDRVRMSFGEEYGITVSSKEGCYTKVSVRIPVAKRTKKETAGDGEEEKIAQMRD